ncbi:MAG TPA: sigma-70 family RNA polymerase sigma factor [Polyangiaceae bacterium]|nr:sigma-70 family RNA polymerase sigma factor [Polyangiaceae bacterium]
MASHSSSADGPQADDSRRGSAASAGAAAKRFSSWEKIPVLCNEEQRALFALLKHRIRLDAASIRARLVESNLHVVVEQARLFRGRGVALADLAQEGCLALIRAVDQFEPPRHAEFARYAVWLIRRRLRRVTRTSVGERERRVFGTSWDVDVVGDPALLDPYASTVRAEVERTAHTLLGLLADEEERILRLRFGIGLDDPQSFEEIGRHLGMDPKRVSRLENRALFVLKRRARRFRAISG